MKIDIVTMGRYHLYDLACELTELGHDVRFISGVPRSRLHRHRISKAETKTTFLEVLRLLIRRQKYFQIEKFEEILQVINSKIARRYIRENADIVIGIADNFFEILKNRPTNSLYVLDRGSSHIEQHIKQQIKALDDHGIEKDYFALTERKILRNRFEYEKSDAILIPSEYVRKSFEAHGFDEEKLLVCAYGANEKIFKPGKSQNAKCKYIIYVGALSVRKNVKELIKVAENLPEVYQLYIAGGIEKDVADFAEKLFKLPNVRYLGFKHQNELAKYYTNASALILPSYDEGLAMVQMQALSCGVPIFSTFESGFSDCIEMTSAGKVLQLDSFTQELVEILNNPIKMAEMKEKALLSSSYATWKRYACDVEAKLKGLLR